MKKWRKIVSLIILITLLGLLVFYFSEIVQKKLIYTLEVPHKSYQIKAYYVNKDATTGNLIRVVKKYDLLGYEKIIANIDRYMDVKSMELTSQHELKIIVGFNDKFAKKTDTVFVKIE